MNPALKNAVNLLYKSREEIENCYGRETPLTDEISEFLMECENRRECDEKSQLWRIINHDVYPDLAIPKGFILAFHQDGIVYEAELTEYENDDGEISYEWHDRYQEYIDEYYGFTHWMPLPEAPEKKE